jgi:hypothetical protein
MAQEYIKQFFRPSKDIDFYQESPEFLSYVKETYVDTKKCISFREKSFFDDEELVLISKSVWTSADHFQEFFNDPLVISDVEKLVAYNTAHNIRLLDILDN